MFERTRRESKTRDRRTRHPLLADWRYAFNGRRRQVRRDSDSGYVQVDHVKPELVLVVIMILFLSALDAYFTLRLIEAGIVTEANPIMRYFMEIDVQLFVNIKTAFTASALLFLVVCSGLKFFNRHRVESILYVVLAGYGALITYHLTLMVYAGLA